MLKGIAVLLMLVHHLFGLPTLVRPPSTWQPVIPGVPVEYMLGRFGKVCVAIFLFVTGYGLAQSADLSWRRTGQRVFSFYRTFWWYFLLLIPVGILFFGDVMTGRGPRFTADPFTLITNALALRTDYAYEWWFAEIYLVLVALSPLILRLVPRKVLFAVGSFVIFALGAALDGRGLRLPFGHPINVMIWQLPFAMGALAATTPSLRLPGPWLSAGVLLVGTIAVERVVPQAMTPWLMITTPLTIVALLPLAAGSGRVLPWLGGLSLPIWLVHPFLCYYFAQELIYAPVYAPLVFAALLAGTLAIVIPSEYLRGKVGRVIARSGKAVRRRSPAPDARTEAFELAKTVFEGRQDGDDIEIGNAVDGGVAQPLHGRVLGAEVTRRDHHDIGTEGAEGLGIEMPDTVEGGMDEGGLPDPVPLRTRKDEPPGPR